MHVTAGRARVAGMVAGLLAAIACSSGTGDGAGRDLAAEVSGRDAEVAAEDVAEEAAPADLLDEEAVLPSGIRVDCKPCDSDLDCAEGARCLLAGVAKRCLHDCVDDGDCPASYTCLEKGRAGKSCAPISIYCEHCTWQAPCGEGLVCDFATGFCKEPAGRCGVCKQDYDCAPGQRCHGGSADSCSGVCLDSCEGGEPCPDPGSFQCLEDARGRMICQPDDPMTCTGCPSSAPFMSPECSCRECLDDSHCDASVGEYCDAVTHTCETTGCPHYNCDGGGVTCADCGCHQCCRDSDCEEWGVPCIDGRCNNIDPCQGACVDPYPYCVVVNDVAQCVHCLTDEDCGGCDSSCHCTGDPTYICL